MKLVDGDETILLVMGSSAAAREKDYPLGLWLRDEIDRRGGGLPYRRALLVGDARYAQSAALQGHPTIAIGGPGSNGIVQQLSTELPVVWMQEDRSFVQMALDEGRRQAAVWGLDADGTKGAVEAFVAQGMLDDLLERIWPLDSSVLS